MADERDLPAPGPTNIAALQVESTSLVARGLVAVRKSLAALEGGDADYLFRIGMVHRTGEGTAPIDNEKAQSYLLAASNLNHAEAQFELAVLFGEHDDFLAAVGWLEKSADLGFGPALQYLAEYVTNPYPIDSAAAELLGKRDYDAAQLYRDATTWYEARAHEGDRRRQRELALMHRRGETNNPNSGEAWRWMKAAAGQGDAYACECLGRWLVDGKDPQHNAPQGIYWLSQAASEGRASACRVLGNLFLYGHTEIAFKKDRVARLIEPDRAIAVSWYERGMALSKARGSYMDTSFLARLYLDGEWLDQNIALAEQMFIDAADAGDLTAQRALGKEYASGGKLKRDCSNALHWLLVAEQNPDASKSLSQYQLGAFYDHDNDGSPNYPEAIRWYRGAANDGDHRSQKRLAEIYELGMGVPKDFGEAYFWYILAGAMSYGKPGIRDLHREILAARNSLGQRLTSSELAAARQLALVWMDRPNSMSPMDHELAKKGLDSAA